MATTQPEVTYDEIARRAYEISQSQECGSDDENWWRAEQELSGPPAVIARPRRRANESAANATSKAKALAARTKATATKRPAS